MLRFHRKGREGRKVNERHGKRFDVLVSLSVLRVLCGEISSREKTAVWRNEKAARQRDGLFFQGRIVLTSSKKTIRTFWRNLIGRRKAVSRNFWRINAFVFNNLINMSTVVP